MGAVGAIVLICVRCPGVTRQILVGNVYRGPAE